MFRKRDLRAAASRIKRELSDLISDKLMDRQLEKKLACLRASAKYKSLPSRSILIIGVQSPKRGNSLEVIYSRMLSDRHSIDYKSCGVGNLGKPENSNSLITSSDLDSFDYVITTDDDIAVPEHFIDDLIAIVEIADIDIAGPAQRLQSFYNLPITRRENISLARKTNYVEVGPLVIFRSNTFSKIFPFPVTKYGWGVDLLWSKVADENGWSLAIIDGTPIRHLSPAGTTYNWEAAHQEMEDFRKENSIPLSVDNLRVLDYLLPMGSDD